MKTNLSVTTTRLEKNENSVTTFIECKEKVGRQNIGINNEALFLLPYFL